jgi:hypothetical protein
VQRQAAAQPGPALTVHAHPEVAAALQGEAAPARTALEARLGRPLAIVPEPAWARETLEIRAA